MGVLLQLIVFACLLCVGYFAGSWLERKHFASLDLREQATRSLLVLTQKTVPGAPQMRDGTLVSGSVVVSVDYFKRLVAGLRNLFGGRIEAYETLLERGRREALLRMKEEAIARGFDAVVCVRVETSRLASAATQGKGTAGVEILAFGTAVKLGADPGAAA